MTIRKIIRNISKNEWRFLIILTIFLIFITSLPYLIGWLTKPVNTYFLAVSALNRVDYPNYFSYIEQIRAGHFLFKDLYTSEPQPRIIFNIFFLGLGILAKFFHLSALCVFHLSRIMLIPVFLLVIYLFISLFFKEKQKRKICLLFITLSSGMAVWLLPLISVIFGSSLQATPMDLWVPEAITFLTLYINPLFIFSLTLIIFIFFLMLLSLENRSHRYAIFAGLASLILFQAHPYHIPTIFLTIGLFWIALSIKQKQFNWQFLKSFLILIFISSPSIAYYYWLNSTNWLTTQRISQAMPVTLTPGAFPLLISYGLLWFLCFIGIYSFFKNKKINTYQLFLIIWLFSQIFLIYSPLPLQRRMTEGLHIVISILASFGLFFIYKKLEEKVSPENQRLFFKDNLLAIILFILFFTSSNIYVLTNDIFMFKNKRDSIPKETIDGMNWLKKNSPQNAIVFSDPTTGNLIPAFAIRTVYIGHGCETAYCKDKLIKTNWFLTNNKYDKIKQEFLKKNNISYIFFDKNFVKGKNIFEPYEKKYLKKVFKEKRVGIYQIISEKNKY